MDCVFHVSYGQLPDWVEQRQQSPLPGDVIDHNGWTYLVMSCLCWRAHQEITFVALTNQVNDDLEETWLLEQP